MAVVNLSNLTSKQKSDGFAVAFCATNLAVVWKVAHELVYNGGQT